MSETFDPSKHYRVALRNNASREMRIVDHAWPWGPEQIYEWTDGNHGCDCNRLWLYNDARPAGTPGWEDSEDEEGICSEGRITALHAILPDGSKIPLDDSATPKECLDKFFAWVDQLGFVATLHEDDHFVVTKS